MKGAGLFLIAGIAGAGFYLYREGFFKNIKHIIRSGTSAGGSKEVNNYFIPGASPSQTSTIAGNPDTNTGTSTSTGTKASGVTIGAANIPSTSPSPSFHLSAISKSGGSVNAIYTGSGSSESKVQRVTYDTNTGKVTNAQSIDNGVVANEFGGFSPVVNGKELAQSVAPPTY